MLVKFAWPGDASSMARETLVSQSWELLSIGVGVGGKPTGIICDSASMAVTHEAHSSPLISWLFIGRILCPDHSD
jgi:hypothetical protein